MKSTLIAYFSASGTTAKLAKTLAQAVGGDLYEIKPAVPYTAADLDWRNKDSRSSVEMRDGSSRPALADGDIDISKYDTIFIGFPIWWYVAPTIINTFLEKYDLTGKVIIPFATSGSSGMGKTNKKLAPSCKGAKLCEGKVFKADTPASQLSEWANQIGVNL